MGTKKLREIETQYSDDADYLTTSPPKKRRTKKRNIMELESKEKGVSRKPKSLKSKDEQALDNSKKPGSNARGRSRHNNMSGLECHENQHPNYFVKCMNRSNVAQGFWLHLPRAFCDVYLPNHDTPIVLVDEWGYEYKTTFLLGRRGLSAGWRGFSLSHRLMEGDILIFHLTQPCKLKVHIARVNSPDVVAAALCLMEMKSSDIAKKPRRKRSKIKYMDHILLDIFSQLDNAKGKNVPNSILDQSASNSHGFSSEVVEGSEVTNRPQSHNLFSSETSFLPDHPRKGVTCT